MKKSLIGAIFFFVAIGTVGVGKASAVSIVPTTEGEIEQTNVACLGGNVTCIDSTKQSTPYLVTSLEYDKKYGLSRLFSDKAGTANNWGFGIKFDVIDISTNVPKGEYVFRPVAYNANGTVIENGQLESGRFKFDFLGKMLSRVELSFFDTEAISTGLLEVNGSPISKLLAPGADGNLQKLTLNNVSSFVVQLGNTTKKDGVDLDVSIPEPSNILGIAGIVVAGGFIATKRTRMKSSI